MLFPFSIFDNVESAIEFQRNLENKAFQTAGNSYAASCQIVGNFLGKTTTKNPNRIQPTYRDGNVTIASFDEIFPRFVSESLRFGLNDFDRKIKGFAVQDAVLTGVETRTSSPLRIMRTDDYLALGFDNLYPCGEGAGYAGGITSAAVDGIKCALALMKKYKNKQ